MLASVSYTHLDVYKRQLIPFVTKEELYYFVIHLEVVSASVCLSIYALASALGHVNAVSMQMINVVCSCNCDVIHLFVIQIFVLIPNIL